ncbi:MAG: hypothetical protein KDB33_15115 [Acidimicrobiales bacterium]|nr:hypothetical protein [Acidimicrobiales bacterium]MCB1261697.1 hypothetical protein [Acidimicrobiales bacterium]
MADTRRAIHAYLSDDAHEAWHEFAAENGVSVSGLLEAMGVRFAERLRDGEAADAELDALTRAARKVDAARRRRSRT